VSRLVQRLWAGFALLAAVLVFYTPGTMSAQTDTDRSLNVDKPTMEPGKTAVATEGSVTISPVSPAATNPETNASPDLSGLTREQLEARIKTLTDSLASANAETEAFRQKWEALKLEEEALGVEALTVDEKAQKDKLVQAVAELYQSEMKRREALPLLDKLLTTTALMLQTAPNYDPKVRADYEVATRAAREYLAGHSGAEIPLASSLTDARISDVNTQLNAIILNVGKNQGVKEGMPFLIYQENQAVGTAKIVLARDMISAALIQDLKPNTVVKVGDRVAVDAGQ